MMTHTAKRIEKTVESDDCACATALARSMTVRAPLPSMRFSSWSRAVLSSESSMSMSTEETRPEAAPYLLQR